MHEILLLQELAKTGILRTDPRLDHMMVLLKRMTVGSHDLDELKLYVQSFRMVMNANVVLIFKAFQNRMVIPAFDVFCQAIEEIYEKVYLPLLLLNKYVPIKACITVKPIFR